MSRKQILNTTLTAILASSAILCASASAEPAGWMANGKNLTEPEHYARSALVTENGKFRFGEVEIECSTLSGAEAQIEPTNKGSAASLILGGCAATSPASCKLEGTTITTVPMVGEATLDGVSAVVGTFAPKTKTLITTIKFLGAMCSVASEIQPITGKVTTLAPTAQDERITQQAIIRQTSAGELKVGTSNASLTGSALFRILSQDRWSFL